MERDIADRAFTLAEMASDESVTMSVLAGRECRFSRAEPLNDPPVTYLGETEAPVYVLTNGKRGIGRGVKRNTVTPDDDFRTVVLVTGRRTLCLVGQHDGDVSIAVPHESVASVQYSTGYRKHRLALTTPRSAYHCWVHRKTSTDLLERVTEFVSDQLNADPEEMDGQEVPGPVMYRGQPLRENGQTGSESGVKERRNDDGTDGETEDGENVRVTHRGEPVDSE